MLASGDGSSFHSSDHFLCPQAPEELQTSLAKALASAFHLCGESSLISHIQGSKISFVCAQRYFELTWYIKPLMHNVLGTVSFLPIS